MQFGNPLRRPKNCNFLSKMRTFVNIIVYHFKLIKNLDLNTDPAKCRDPDSDLKNTDPQLRFVAYKSSGSRFIRYRTCFCVSKA
jgi:hypothetical protein